MVMILRRKVYAVKSSPIAALQQAFNWTDWNMLQPIDVEAQVTADAGRTFMTFYEKATDCEHLQVSFCSKVHGAMQQTSRSSNPLGVYKHIPTQKKRHAGPKFGSITYSQIIKEIINIFIPFDYFFLMLSRAFLFVLLSSTSHFFAAAMAHFPYRGD